MSLEPHDASLPRISVLIAVRNGVATIQRALDSVYEQTYPNVELVVIDGASTDGTREVLERNADRIAYWKSEPDRGIYDAWNKALDRATGDWLCFLGADDRYHGPEVIAQVAGILAEDGGAHRVVYGDLNKVFADGSVHERKERDWSRGRRRRFRQGAMIPHPATFHHRALFEEHGRFDEQFRIAGDYEFLLRELLDHDALHVPVPVVDWAAGGVSDRGANKYLVRREVYQARHMHGVAKVPPWRSLRLYKSLLDVWIDRHLRRRSQGKAGAAPGPSPASGADASE